MEKTCFSWNYFYFMYSLRIKKSLCILGILTFTTEMWSLPPEPENDQGLLSTVMHDLRGAHRLDYDEGEIRVENDLDHHIPYTPFCSNVPQVSVPQKHLSPMPSLESHLEVWRNDVQPLKSFSPETVLGRIVPGKDGRTRVSPTTELPHRLHGQLIAYFFDGKTRWEAKGSGTLVGPHHVLTAGHCIYDHKVGGWATHVTFIPGKDDGKHPFGEARGAILLSVQNWVNRESPAYDMGMVILDRPIGHLTGWAGLYPAPGGLHGNPLIHITGYPTDKPNQMWTMFHYLETLTNEQIEYNIDTYEGQSGSGVHVQRLGKPGYYVVGIHAYGVPKTQVNDTDQRNKATYLTLPKFNRVVRWMELYQLPQLAQTAHPFLIKPRLTHIKLEGIGEIEIKEKDLSLANQPITHSHLCQMAQEISSFIEHLDISKSVESSVPKLQNKDLIHFASRSWRSLKSLDLSGNNISAEGILLLVSIANLEYLNLSVNKIMTAEADLTGILRWSWLWNNKSTTGMEALSALSNLTELNLSCNDIVDEGLQKLTTLKNLKSLSLWNNKISSVGVQKLSILRNLTWLNLGCNYIGDEGAQKLSVLTNLISLNLFENKISSVGVQKLTRLRNLIELNLGHNGVGDTGAQNLGTLTNLITLYLANTGMGDAGAQKLSTLRNLITLDLTYNNIGDIGAQKLTILPNLISLSLHNNCVTDKGAQSLSTLPNLTSLNLRRNKIGDKGAQSLGALTHLTWLNLEKNNIGVVTFRTLRKKLPQCEIFS